jgi:hypothetical protein
MNVFTVVGCAVSFHFLPSPLQVNFHVGIGRGLHGGPKLEEGLLGGRGCV